MAIPLMSDALIHHDGSSLYVPEQRPKLGQKIKLRIRIHETFGDIRQVLIRQSDSGEAFLGEKLKVFAKRHGWSWYEGSITIHNPQVHYRFFIDLKNKDSFWLNARGLYELDQSDRFDFRINIFNSVPKWQLERCCMRFSPTPLPEVRTQTIARLQAGLFQGNGETG